MECTLSADNQLGPRVLPACREFDFTLLFEQWILAFLPDIVFLILCLLRCYQIHADSRKVRRHFTGTWKIVGCSASCMHIPPPMLTEGRGSNPHTGAYYATLLAEAQPPRSVVLAACSENSSLHSVSHGVPSKHRGTSTALTLRTLTIIAAVDFDLSLPADHHPLRHCTDPHPVANPPYTLPFGCDIPRLTRN